MHHFLDVTVAGGPFGSKDVVLDDEEQGFAGSEAPRPASRRRLEPGRRGARRRKNKGLRGAEHHVPQTAGALSSEDVVLDDERTRACGRRSTTSGTPAAPWAPKTWCLTTKEQGFAESEAPRPSGNASPRAGGHQKRTDAQSILLILLIPLIPYFTFRVFVVFQLDCSFFWILACSCQVRAKCSRPLESDWK